VRRLQLRSQRSVCPCELSLKTKVSPKINRTIRRAASLASATSREQFHFSRPAKRIGYSRFRTVP
jgi:hypothetical protein